MSVDLVPLQYFGVHIFYLELGMHSGLYLIAIYSYLQILISFNYFCCLCDGISGSPKVRSRKLLEQSFTDTKCVSAMPRNGCRWMFDMTTVQGGDSCVL